jgi:hypothetical protein
VGDAAAAQTEAVAATHSSAAARRQADLTRVGDDFNDNDFGTAHR